MDALGTALDGLGAIASTTIDMCGWALDCDRIGSDFAKSLHEWVPCIPDVGLYWRSNVVILGMVITGIGTLAAVANGVASVAIAFFTSFLILSFSLYYISRYAELAEMEAQLGVLKGACAGIQMEVARFEQANRDLAQTVGVLSDGATSMQASTAASTDLERQIARSLQRLQEIQQDAARAEAERTQHATHSQLLQSQILGRTQTLLQVTQQLVQIKDEFAKVSQELQTSAGRFETAGDAQDAHTQALSSLLQRLSGIVRWAEQLQIPQGPAMGGVAFQPTASLFA